jgi:apolipoprotein N-acyltransferase
LLLSPFLWVGMELARTYLITGFPWDLLGYAVRPAGLRQLASLTGIYGLSFLAVATSALAAWAIRSQRAAPWDGPAAGSPGRWRRNRPAVVLAGWIVLLLAGNWALTPPAPARTTNLALLLQPNVPLDESEDASWAPWVNPGKLSQLVTMSLDALAAQQKADQGGENGKPAAAPLVIWAENPAPFYFTRDLIFRSAIVSMARLAKAYVVVNTVVPQASGNSEITNSALVVDPQGREILQYDKIHLVPFGEYVPFWALPSIIGKITSEVGTFIPGTSYRVARTPEGAIGVFICYEDIFPQLVRRLALAGANVLVNISNDAWYGDSAAAFQHLEMARFRAIENRRYLLRATNNGITALIDPYGRVEQQIPRHEAAVLAAHFRYLTGKTFYTRHGDLFAWVCAVLGVAGVAAGFASGRFRERPAAGTAVCRARPGRGKPPRYAFLIGQDQEQQT